MGTVVSEDILSPAVQVTSLLMNALTAFQILYQLL